MQGDALAEAVLARARAGDEEAFRALTDPHRRELQLHCYRILGSVHDAEDMVQETLLAAWRSLEAFEGRASVRSWLYRIATNRCLNALRARARRRPGGAVRDVLEQHIGIGIEPDRLGVACGLRRVTHGWYLPGAARSGA